MFNRVHYELMRVKCSNLHTYILCLKHKMTMHWYNQSPIEACAARSQTELWVMVFNATFNNISAISWRSILLLEETGVPG